MPELAPELWILLPLAIAAGLDLYLTLLVIGAASTLPWWDHPLPGALSDLDAVSIILVVGGLYILEFLAERRRGTGLVWNAVHAIIRPVSGGLLAALLLHGQALEMVLGGAVLGGGIAALAHAARSGAGILRWLEPGVNSHALLRSMVEDAVVVGLVLGALHHPQRGLAAGVVVVAFGLPGAASRIRGFVFATRFLAARAFQSIRERAWTPTERIPAWVRKTLADHIMAPGGGLRGTRAAVSRMRGLPRFATGWLVIRGDAPAFVHRRRGRAGTLVGLDDLTLMGVEEEAFFRRADLRDEEGRDVRMYFFVHGPGTAAVASELRPRRGEKNL